MHAVLGRVSIAPGQFDGSLKALRGEVVFDSKQSAENAMTMARNSPMPPGVAFVSIEIREVTADA
jgi:hypothetical protein